MMLRARDFWRGMQVRTIRSMVTAGAVLAGVAGTQPWSVPDARAQQDQAYLVGGVRAFDFIQDDDAAADFRIEYRHGAGIWFIKPWFGLEGTSDGALYGVGGLLADINLGRRLVLTPSLGVGAYAEGDGKDLGSAIEFRSQVELAYRLDNDSRIGIAFSHISNAGIGDENPGTEVINLYYALPIGSLF